MADVDLYDDLDDQEEEGFNEDSNDDERKDKSRSQQVSSSSARFSNYAVYIGNLTWWTTDQNLIEAMQNLGVKDVEEIKFYENRNNGQSKGFCLVTLGSENSCRIVMEKLPTKDLHGQRPVVTTCTKQNLFYFESQSKKDGHVGGGRQEKFKDKRYKEHDQEARDGNRSMHFNKSRDWNDRNRNYSRDQNVPHGSTSHHSFQGTPSTQYPPGQAPWPPAPLSQVQLPPPIPVYSGPPPPQLNTGMPPPPPGLQAPPPTNLRFPPPKGSIPPMVLRSVPPPDIRGPPPPDIRGPPPNNSLPPHLVGPSGKPPSFVQPPGQVLPPPSSALNPLTAPFYQQQSNSPGQPPVSKPAEIYNRHPTAQFPDYRPINDRGKDAVSETEFEEIMSRNRSVSSSAINRAVADASSGDYANAVETLVTAISLIKQSKIASDERCKIFISTLQDTLHGIESKLYRSRSKDRSVSRDRERSRERHSRREKSSRRDRSRSRERDYRDRSRDRERYHEDRYREKDRDHRSSRH